MLERFQRPGLLRRGISFRIEGGHKQIILDLKQFHLGGYFTLREEFFPKLVIYSFRIVQNKGE